MSLLQTNFRRLALIVAVAFALCGGARVGAGDENVWPFVVRRDATPGPVTSWQAVGPLAFWQPLDAGRTARGVRPVYVLRTRAEGQREGGSFLYPLARWEHYPDGFSWNIFNLIQHRVVDSPQDAADMAAFEVWPFYFSRQTGDPATSYRAVFPLYGDINNRFGQDRWKWVLFPFYGRFEQNGVTTTTAPWPFVKVLRGDGNRGFELWPAFGRRSKAGVYRSEFLLWPFAYREQTNLSSSTPARKAGILPFYAIDQRPGYVSETFGWPFWGYVDRTEPYRYHATHYFWPIWVQGRGDDRYVNRWGPFYTHSVVRGLEKRWFLWPVWHQRAWDEGQLHHERRQLLYFVYYSNVQRSRTNPSAAPAHKTHLWPLVSVWDNGAGRRQVQAPSPLEVFFPNNEHIRLTWSPLFALYRFDQSAPGAVRHSLLWDAVSYERSTAERTREFHLGPLFRWESRPERREFGLLHFFRFERETGRRGWRFSFHRSRPADVAPTSP